MKVIYRDGYVREDGIDRPMTEEEKKQFPPFPTRSPMINIEMEYPEPIYETDGRGIEARIALILMVIAIGLILTV